MQNVKFIGLDVHEASIAIAVAEGDGGPAEVVTTTPNELGTVLERLRKLAAGREAYFRYEAGPTGFGLCRALREAGFDCRVVAPSLVPQQAGDRIKTDRRDAIELARLLRSGDLSEVHVPDAATEAIRDLERAREDRSTRKERRAIS